MNISLQARCDIESRHTQPQSSESMHFHLRCCCAMKMLRRTTAHHHPCTAHTSNGVSPNQDSILTAAELTCEESFLTAVLSVSMTRSLTGMLDPLQSVASCKTERGMPPAISYASVTGCVLRALSKASTDDRHACNSSKVHSGT